MAVARGRALILLVTAAAVVVAAFAAPAWCSESRLAGAAIGDTPEELLASGRLGTPDGVFSPGNVFNPTRGMPGGTPPWALAVMMEQLASDQVQWVYNRDPVAVGFLIAGQGINAHVTDISVSMWRNFYPSKLAKTAKGTELGAGFAEVLGRYGWPNRIQVIGESGQTQAATPQLSGGPGGPGGGAGRAIVGGRPWTGGTFTGIQPLPNVGPGVPVPAAVAPARAVNTAVAPVGETSAITFTKSCIMSYPSVDFVIYRMKVFRIHIYGR